MCLVGVAHPSAATVKNAATMAKAWIWCNIFQHAKWILCWIEAFSADSYSSSLTVYFKSYFTT